MPKPDHFKNATKKLTINKSGYHTGCVKNCTTIVERKFIKSKKTFKSKTEINRAGHLEECIT